jgi:hypothetical protein
MTISKTDLSLLISVLALLQSLGLGPLPLVVAAAFLLGRLSR